MKSDNATEIKQKSINNKAVTLVLRLNMPHDQYDTVRIFPAQSTSDEG